MPSVPTYHMNFRWNKVWLSASGPVVLLILTGFVFWALDVLDINEYYSLSWSIPAVNTVFIGGTAVIIAGIALWRYRSSGSWLVLGTGCAVLLFGTATVLKAWLELDLIIRISLRDYSVLLVAIVYLISVLIDRKSSRQAPTISAGWMLPAVGYAVMVGAVVLVTWMVYTGWLPELTSGPEITGVPRMAIQGGAAVIVLIAALCVFLAYRTQPEAWYIWYTLGLLLFGFGELYIALGGLTGKLAWTGRSMQYLSGFYLLIMLLKYRPKVDSISEAAALRATENQPD